jgi:hypothetical protein
MARRGQCRCGLILTFHRSGGGYKMRCPGCGAVVRLRVKGKKRRRPRPEATVIQPVAADLPPSDEIDVELVSLSELAVGAPRHPRRPGKLWLVVVGGGAAVLAAAAGLLWWYW